MLAFSYITHVVLYATCVFVIIVLSVVLWSKARKYVLSKEQMLLQLKEHNEELQTLNSHITLQRDLLHQYHLSITESLNYTSHLQQAILPDNTILANSSFNHFIFFKPRDVVSGDFYFIKNVKNKLIIAIADCTGHGVPGACLSMMGTAYLSEIVLRADAQNAGQVLNILRDKVKSTFNQSNNNYYHDDGMDMSLCIIDRFTNQMQFAGANQNIVLVKSYSAKPWSCEISVIKGDAMPIGKYPHEKANFTNHEIQLKQGDSFYIFSDGFVSQFGGKKDKKFKTSRFRKVLQHLQNRPMSDQREVLERIFNNWRGEQQQVDDVLVIGMQLKSQDEILHNLQEVLITWDNNLYSVGSAIIDYQHKQLVLHINQLYDAYMKKSELAVIDNILEQLEAYIGYHFQTEEKFLLKQNNDDIKSHLAEHQFFTSRVSDFMAQYYSGKVNISYNLILFLKDWLITHIQQRDYSCRHLLGAEFLV